MVLRIRKNKTTALTRLRQLGYSPYANREDELTFVKRIHGTDFPRFHLYVEREDQDTLFCTLHLDQAGPWYLKGKAHRGDYDTPEVKAEAKQLEDSR